MHRRVEHLYVSAERILPDVSAATLRRRVAGEELEETRRHGKHLFLRVVDRWLRLHFGMSGRVEVFEDGDGSGPDPEHTHLRFDFDDEGHLDFIHPRRLGEIGLVDGPEAFVEDAGLGPDALDDDLEARDLASLLEGRRGMIQSALMDQELIAGIGNVYGDEILFQARVHPRRRVAELTDDRIGEIHRQMGRVLRAAIDAGVEDLPDWFLLPHRGEGGTCPECGTERESIDVSGGRRGCVRSTNRRSSPRRCRPSRIPRSPGADVAPRRGGRCGRVLSAPGGPLRIPAESR